MAVGGPQGPSSGGVPVAWGPRAGEGIRGRTEAYFPHSGFGLGQPRNKQNTRELQSRRLINLREACMHNRGARRPPRVAVCIGPDFLGGLP